jgi:hypothetical protein
LLIAAFAALDETAALRGAATFAFAVALPSADPARACFFALPRGCVFSGFGAATATFASSDFGRTAGLRETRTVS